MTGIGTVPVQVPRVRDRGAHQDGSKIRFRPAVVLPYLRKAKSVEELLPWLYLKGISTGDFSEALAALPGPEAEGRGIALLFLSLCQRGKSICDPPDCGLQRLASPGFYPMTVARSGAGR